MSHVSVEIATNYLQLSPAPVIEKMLVNLGSDLLVINKIDLAFYVGADLGEMERDTKKMRGNKPFVFTNLKTQVGLATVIDFVQSHIC